MKFITLLVQSLVGIDQVLAFIVLQTLSVKHNLRKWLMSAFLLFLYIYIFLSTVILGMLKLNLLVTTLILIAYGWSYFQSYAIFLKIFLNYFYSTFQFNLIHKYKLPLITISYQQNEVMHNFKWFVITLKFKKWIPVKIHWGRGVLESLLKCGIWFLQEFPNRCLHLGGLHKHLL